MLSVSSISLGLHAVLCLDQVIKLFTIFALHSRLLYLDYNEADFHKTTETEIILYRGDIKINPTHLSSKYYQ